MIGSIGRTSPIKVHPSAAIIIHTPPIRGVGVECIDRWFGRSSTRSAEPLRRPAEIKAMPVKNEPHAYGRMLPKDMFSSVVNRGEVYADFSTEEVKEESYVPEPRNFLYMPIL